MKQKKYRMVNRAIIFVSQGKKLRRDSVQDLVSIIIPIYNMEKSLEKCVRSILKQDYKNIEVILVDDGSKDNCCAIYEKLREEDFRVECIHTENQGSCSPVESV